MPDAGSLIGEFDAPIAVGHHLRHQRAEVGVDDLVVVVDQLGEAEDIAVEVDEGVHLTELDVADAVIDFEQVQSLGGTRRRGDLSISRRERPVVVSPVDERVERLAIRPDRRLAQHTVLAAVDLGRLQRRDGTAGGRLAPRRPHVGDTERDVVDTIAVLADMLGDLALGGQGCREHEANVVLDHDVARPIADLRFEAAERHRGEAPQRPVVGRCLAGIAHPELDMIDAVERKEVAGLGVGVRIDPGAGLVGRASRERLGHRAYSAACG